MSEIWIAFDEIKLYNIPGYNTYAKCNNNYRAGGIQCGCFIEKSILVHQIEIYMLTADGLMLNVRLGNTYFKIFSLYRLQQFSENQFVDELTPIINNLNNNVIYLGDINLNLLRNNNLTQKYQSILNNNGFLSFVNSPTRITPTSKACVDHIFIRSKNTNHFRAAVFDAGITDHYVLCLNI